MLKIVKSIFVVLAVAALVSGATGAVFSDQEAIAGNTFATGTLDITLETYGTKPYTVVNAYPGFTTPGEWVTISNVGTLGGNLAMSAVQTDDSALLYGVLNIEVRAVGPGGPVLYNGPIAGLSIAPYFLGSDAGLTIWERLYLDLDLPGDDNDYQGLSTEFSEIFDITQP